MTQIIYYKSIKIGIHLLQLKKIIIIDMMRYICLLDFILSDINMLLTWNFWFSLYFFFDIKKILFITFYPQVDGSTKRQKIFIKFYFRVFVNKKLNNRAKFIFLLSFSNNNAKNMMIDHISFELYCEYYSTIFFKKKRIYTLNLSGYWIE